MQADREKQMHSPIRIAIISTGVQSSVVDQATNGFVMTLKNAKVLVAESSQDSVGTWDRIGSVPSRKCS